MYDNTPRHYLGWASVWRRSSVMTSAATSQQTSAAVGAGHEIISMIITTLSTWCRIELTGRYFACLPYTTSSLPRILFVSPVTVDWVIQTVSASDDSATESVPAAAAAAAADAAQQWLLQQLVTRAQLSLGLADRTHGAHSQPASITVRVRCFEHVVACARNVNVLTFLST